MTADIVSRRLEVNGIVQGVGFRPFVFQLARDLRLNGQVANTSSGVRIHIEGTAENVAAFKQQLARNHPPLAHIIDIRDHHEPAAGYSDFSIVASQGGGAMQTLISPDVSICDDCRRELFDPQDRRRGYPFINCTNCGPRFTIIEDIPYDRPKTSMKHFRMCTACQTEYDDPHNRRFHAQPNACAECGPEVTLYDHRRRCLDGKEPVQHTIELLKKGFVVAVKGLGGFHLAADAENDAAVSALRRRKHREEKPLALMSLDVDHIRRYAEVRPDEAALLTSQQRPIVLLRQKTRHAISSAVAPNNRYFGAMLPYTPLHYLLLEGGFTALVMTSGNLSEEPIAIDNDDAFARLADIADYLLVHNRDIYLRCDDSIVRRSAGDSRFIRRSRGFVPRPVILKNKMPRILAVGAELKNTICLLKGNLAFVSQHIGDLENLPTYAYFQQTIDHMQRILEMSPDIIAHDLHPDYLSTRYAEQRTDLAPIAVQHHHAHIVSAMAENQIDGPVIGLAFDGTGYGADGKIWGGEVLIAEAKDFTRVAHLDYVPMPGGAAAIKEPWRMTVSHLQHAYGDDWMDLDLPPIQRIDAAKINTIRDMIRKRINSPETSSLGRLFDAVAALLGIRQQVAFEGQAAMELEMVADGSPDEHYETAFDAADGIHRIHTGPLIKGVVTDMLRGQTPAAISARFHASLVVLFAGLCGRLGKTHNLDRVVLSGGVFQNSRLLETLIPALTQKGFRVYTHSQVPANDGGIALGQAVAAAAMIN